MKQLILELIVRFASKSPKLFKGLQWLIGIVTALLSILTYIQENGLLQLPEWVVSLTGPEGIITAAIAYIISRLPVANDAQKEVQVQRLMGKK